MSRDRIAPVLGILLLAVVVPGKGLAFEPVCPDESPIEVGLVPFARSTATACECLSFVSCMNLEKKKSASVSVQWFLEGPAPYTQQGDTVTRQLLPGEHEQFPTGYHSSAPYIAFPANSANIAGDLDLSGRVCATTRRLACHAGLVCNCAGSIDASPLTYIVKKQKGD